MDVYAEKPALRNITLEVSLKPFSSLEDADIEAVAAKIFTQWMPFLRCAQTVSVLFWAADGSEILDYRGDMADTFEWAKYIGGANPRQGWDQRNDPRRINLHAVHYDYVEAPPVYTYGDYKRLLGIVQRVGHRLTGLPVRLGATFDPGPEFAKSSFKYERHNEICLGESMGRSSMVCCYARLDADDTPYAGFPQGILQGTPVGTFLGRQAQHFLRDMGFDYLWLSNGFGFGTETWGLTGAIFDKTAFHDEKVPEVQARILEFWRLFRAECSYPVETRGTNQSLGIDYATDAVDHKGIYEGGFDVTPPCNSPWAAINGDFGMELAGHLSRIAMLPPGKGYPFRFYVHDPWWMNSPWIDRYERQPHDIYLPLALSRVGEDGRMQPPCQVNLLTVDNSLGQLPPDCPLEIQPHLMRALQRSPDALPPVTWVYPFDEYSRCRRASKPFFEDMFMRGAINHGFPVSAVVSTANYLHLAGGGGFKSTVLCAPVPEGRPELAKALLMHARQGGNLILYGGLAQADAAVRDALGLDLSTPLSGRLGLALAAALDEGGTEDGLPMVLQCDALLSDGGMCAVPAGARPDGTGILAEVYSGTEKRVFAAMRRFDGGGHLVWVRGANGGSFAQPGDGNITPYPCEEAYPVENLMRKALALCGYGISFKKADPCQRDPVVLMHRNGSALYYSGYCPDAAVGVCLKTPLGVPLLLGQEGILEGGIMEYRFGRAWQHECRVFVSGQSDGRPACREMAPVSYFMHRRIEVTGLRNATLTILPKVGFEHMTEVLVNPQPPFVVGQQHLAAHVDTPLGRAIVVEGVSGKVVVSDKCLD